MRSGLVVAAVALALGSAFALYMVKYDTRLVAERVAALDTKVAETEARIAILKAEAAKLARPERLEPLARKHLGLGPLAGTQIGSAADLPWREPEAGSP